MTNAFTQMADTERRADLQRNSQSALPSKGQVFNALLNNALGFVNAYQVPRDLGANIVNAFVQAPGEIYKASRAHLTGEIPLTGERDREGAIHAFNALGNAGMALGPFAGRALHAVASTSKPAAGIKAYHGSPHDFDKFKMSQIGTGEGAQDYGHGLYFAESPGVAKSYQSQLSTPLIEGRGINRNDPAEFAAELMWRTHGDKDSAINFASTQSRMRSYEQPLVSPDVAEQTIAKLKSGEELPKIDGGRLYEVNIKANKDDFLDWDKPLNEQPESVRRALEADARRYYGSNYESQRNFFETKSGGEAINTVDPMGVGSAERMETMRKAGIPGIKYLDQGSRGSGQGTYNYVIFDEDLVEITKKMGIAVPIPGVPGVVVSEEDFKALEGA